MITTAHRGSFTSDLRQDIHDLSQPLTRLQWRLELGCQGTEPELRECMKAALDDAFELMAWVRRLRTRIEAEENAR